MRFFQKNKILLVFFIVVFSVLFSFYLLFGQKIFPFPQDRQSQIDILVFSPHPDDETLCCGGTIIKAIKKRKKVKVVFLTNGDGFETSASLLFGKKAEELVPEDYIQLGEERQKEAIDAARVLGLKENDLIFLGYPDGELSFLYDKFYHDYYLSEKTKATSSPYELADNLVQNSYTKENLIFALKELLEKYKPKKLFLPHILDSHPDHQTTNKFVSFSLDDLKADENQDWLNSLEIFYYLIHNPTYGIGQSSFFSVSWPDEKSVIIEEPTGFSQRAKENENIFNVKTQKAEALKKYYSQLLVPDIQRLFGNFSNKENEIFWKTPGVQKEKIQGLEEEWEIIGIWLKNNGYNINFGPVADVANNLQDLTNPLTRRERIFSQNPETVSQLLGAIVKGSNKAGITPVVKHFPGLGTAKDDTHVWLSKVNLSKEELFQRDLLPYRNLIKEKSPFWIMMGHGVYPSLSKEPASLSFEIQTQLLRKELGFQGIIIDDDLWAMGAMREYAKQEGFKEPFTGELVIRAFQAGTDIVILFLPPPEADKIVSNVIKEVKKAVQEGRIKEGVLNDSLERILKEKERIFNKPFKNLIKEMSTEEKIGQKIIIDIWGKENLEIFKKYNLGGMRPYDNVEIIKEAQKIVKIPLFVTAQHEGGVIKQSFPDIFTKSAYLVGKEFEGIKKEKKLAENSGGLGEEDIFEVLPKLQREQIFNAIIIALNEAIRIYPILYQRTMSNPNPNYRTPLIVDDADDVFELKSPDNLPPQWLQEFPDEKRALAGYQILKKIFIEWLDDSKSGRIKIEKDTISQLKSLKEKVRVESSNVKKLRILSLATHPDDEDSEGLAYFKYKFDFETYILLATRGEGGENKIKSLLYEDLGRLRTEEIEKAGEVLGVNKVYYLNEKDFGYCVSEKEAQGKWDKEEVLKKLIYFYRFIKPHIIITKNAISDEHCQHKIFVSLALEAFDLSSNPEVYPEMLKEGLLTWQPLKFYQRIFTFQDEIFVDITERDSLSGKTYKEIAIESLRQHQTQDPEKWMLSFWPDKINYQLIKSRLKNGNNLFFSGIKNENLR